MHLAILMTNTDDSAFSRRHPDDGQKFTDLIGLARPGWRCSVIRVCDGEVPARLEGVDGAMITGSPASVRSDLPWIAPLLALIRRCAADRLPLFGACFGHQAMALALGGAVGRNPGGWIQGLVESRISAPAPWMDALPEPLRLFASHVEQVTALPPEAVAVQTAPGCALAGFRIGRHGFTTQHHPEMTEGFFSALSLEMAATLGPDLTDRAVASAATPAHRAAYAEALARFFETSRSL